MVLFFLVDVLIGIADGYSAVTLKYRSRQYGVGVAIAAL